MKKLTPKYILIVLISSCTILAAGMAFHIVYPRHVVGFSQFFNFDYERNLPTFFQTMLWMLSGVLCLRVSRLEPALRLQWLGAGVIAFFLGADEYLAIHDQLNAPLRSMFDLKGVFFYGWVLVYGALLLTLFPFTLRFVTRLPRSLCLQFVVSGCVFVLGAFGVELLGGYWASNQLSSNNYVYITTLEESLEILGQCLFFYFLYRYLFKINPSKVFRQSSQGSFYLFCAFCILLIALNRFEII